MKLIIVEGIDRVGKTTLIQKIKERVNGNCIVMKDSYIDNGDINEANASEKLKTTLNMLDAIERSKVDVTVILDRFHWTELVYGYVDRKYLNVYANEVDRHISLNYKDATIILVAPTNLKRSSDEHGKDLTAHDIFFMTLTKATNIKNVRICDYNSMKQVIEKLF